MIVTKSWLNEFVEISDLSTERLCKTFNAIGLEVDSVTHFALPQKVVLGKVLECVAHPDAGKLSVCQVDVGGAVRQIVCGASNVRAGIYVPVAMIGAEMPGGLVIKPVELRGVQSEGMICSASELGLPKTEEGIMVLDESIGVLEVGKALQLYPALQDDPIEIELTANRGDCLSIHGIARDVSAALNRSLREMPVDTEKEGRIGIGRIAHLHQSEPLEADLSYRAVDVASLELPVLVRLRLAMLEESYTTELEGLLLYAVHATGVIMRLYDRKRFAVSDEQKLVIDLGRDDEEFEVLRGADGVLSSIGVSQEEQSKPEANEAKVLIEASYVDPERIARKMAQSKRKSSPLYYRSARGSEPVLDFGLSYFFDLLAANAEAKVYGGSIDVLQSVQPLHVTVSTETINAFIGAKIEKTTILQILKKLGFGIEKSQGEQFAVEVPRYRHDIQNRQDIVEEIVRLVGIDNIPSKPFVFKEDFRFNDDYRAYQKRREYRYKAAYSGFFESVHFVFGEKQKFEQFGFTCTHESKALLNPITANFDTLRPSLMLGLLEAASLNAKSGQKRIALFEIGSVFDPQRHESVRMAMLCSGYGAHERISNAGRPEMIDFAGFVQKVSDVIGAFELKSVTEPTPLMHPYQAARIVQNGQEIGTLFRLHPEVQAAYDLEQTLVCELDFVALDDTLKTAKPYSKYQASYRDLSLVVSDILSYEQLAETIARSKSEEVIRFYAVDRYKDASLGASSSLTIRFVLQSLEKTLSEEEIAAVMDRILSALGNELGVVLR
ncbi:MAG: phenylalanine--tRNA ligase subunit beta [Campylobacterales bacterium]|nr:phenylalanine--tRNA ligase subunit beta [Campylobacterales bacterium]